MSIKAERAFSRLSARVFHTTETKISSVGQGKPGELYGLKISRGESVVSAISFLARGVGFEVIRWRYAASRSRSLLESYHNRPMILPRLTTAKTMEVCDANEREILWASSQDDQYRFTA